MLVRNVVIAALCLRPAFSSSPTLPPTLQPTVLPPSPLSSPRPKVSDTEASRRLSTTPAPTPRPTPAPTPTPPNCLTLGFDYGLKMQDPGCVDLVDINFDNTESARSTITTPLPSARPTITTPLPSARPTINTPLPSARPTITTPLPSARPTPVQTTPLPSARPTTTPPPTPRPTTPAPTPKPNCLTSDFDYGLKMEDPGCVDLIEEDFNNNEYLEVTFIRPGTSCSRDDGLGFLDGLGTYSLDCKDEEDPNEFNLVDIETSVDVAVFINAGTGGTRYDLTAGQLHNTLSPGNGKAISHIEFCFHCETAPTFPPTRPPTQRPPTPVQTPLPSARPITTPPPTPRPTTPAPTAWPTPQPITPAPTPGPPLAMCEATVVLAAGSDCQSHVEVQDFVDNGSYDPDGNLSVFPLGPYQHGETEVTLTVTGANGATDSCTSLIIVEDMEELDAANLELDYDGLMNPQDAPLLIHVSYPAKANGCGTSLDIFHEFCHACNPAGKVVNRDSCEVDVLESGSEKWVLIGESGGVGNHIALRIQVSDGTHESLVQYYTVCVDNIKRNRHLKKGGNNFSCPEPWDPKINSFECV